MRKLLWLIVCLMTMVSTYGQDGHIWKIVTEDGTQISSFGYKSKSGVYYLQELGNRNWIKVNHIYGRWEFDLPNGVELVDESKVPKEIKVENSSKKTYDVVEQMPSFPGGQQAMMDFISSNLHYPIVAQENGVQGRVVVSFVVEKDGSLSDIKVTKSVDPSLDKEAARIVKTMPKWVAGKRNGSCVRVRYNVPISFRLQ
jgi:TonB family protein